MILTVHPRVTTTQTKQTLACFLRPNRSHSKNLSVADTNLKLWNLQFSTDIDQPRKPKDKKTIHQVVRWRKHIEGNWIDQTTVSFTDTLLHHRIWVNRSLRGFKTKELGAPLTAPTRNQTQMVLEYTPTG